MFLIGFSVSGGFSKRVGLVVLDECDDVVFCRFALGL